MNTTEILSVDDFKRSLLVLAIGFLCSRSDEPKRVAPEVIEVEEHAREEELPFVPREEHAHALRIG